MQICGKREIVLFSNLFQIHTPFLVKGFCDYCGIQNYKFSFGELEKDNIVSYILIGELYPNRRNFVSFHPSLQFTVNKENDRTKIISVVPLKYNGCGQSEMKWFIENEWSLNFDSNTPVLT